MLSGEVIFNETGEKVKYQKIGILSPDISLDTTISCDNSGHFEINLSKSDYIINISGDSLAGGQWIELKRDTVISLKAYYNPYNDFKIFKSGFKNIYQSRSSTLGFKENMTFRKTNFIDNYFIYSYIENGVFEIRQDSIILKTISIDGYNSNLTNSLLNKVYFFRIQQDSILVDQTNEKFYPKTFLQLKVQFDEINKLRFEILNNK